MKCESEPMEEASEETGQKRYESAGWNEELGQLTRVGEDLTQKR